MNRCAISLLLLVGLVQGCGQNHSEFDEVLDKFDEMVGVYESYTQKDPFCVEYVVQINGEVLLKLNDVAAKAKHLQEAGPKPSKEQMDRYIRTSTRMSSAMLALGQRMKGAKMCGSLPGATGSTVQTPEVPVAVAGKEAAAEPAAAPVAKAPESTAPPTARQPATQEPSPPPVKSEIPSPSFDCARASTPVERMICASPELSRLDGQLADLYGKARTSSSDPEQLKSEQVAWIRQSRKCPDEGCIAQSYKSRIAELARLVR